ncbi:class III signal peptide-containing protein [Methanothermococcus sp. SCGC AD-155-E23]|nr:class III signal peptide-containing protein [Methanothermococcus sp. SCGC AD-155-E23]
MSLIIKLLSKRGQVSMEIGILIIATITVSTIAIYYYINNYINLNSNAPQKAVNETINSLSNVSKKYSNLMKQ